MSYWYAIQTFGGNEEKSRELINVNFPQYETLLPKRELLIRRGGKSTLERRSLFPGYFFLRSKKPIDSEAAKKIIEAGRHVGLRPGILRILGRQQTDFGDDAHYRAIPSLEMNIILELTQNDETIHFSQFIKEGKRVVFIGGPLKGKDVIIRKVNPRKNRITVEFSILGQSHRIDVGGELVRETSSIN